MQIVWGTAIHEGKVGPFFKSKAHQSDNKIIFFRRIKDFYLEK